MDASAAQVLGCLDPTVQNISTSLVQRFTIHDSGLYDSWAVEAYQREFGATAYFSVELWLVLEVWLPHSTSLQCTYNIFYLFYFFLFCIFMVVKTVHQGAYQNVLFLGLRASKWAYLSCCPSLYNSWE